MPSLIDRAIGALFPARGLAREQAMLRLSAVRGLRNEYEGASHSRRTQGWRRTNKDANYELLGAAQVLAATARDMVRNNTDAANFSSKSGL